MRLNFMPVLGRHGFYKLAYREWGDPANPRVLNLTTLFQGVAWWRLE